jgi:cytochrome c biogenesis protein ResB
MKIGGCDVEYVLMVILIALIFVMLAPKHSFDRMVADGQLAFQKPETRPAFRGQRALVETGELTLSPWSVDMA